VDVLLFVLEVAEDLAEATRTANERREDLGVEVLAPPGFIEP